MAKWVFAIFALFVVLTGSNTAQAGFPHNGKFKMQPASEDTWYYYDNIHWYLKAPDKWQHLMGSYASTKVFTAAFDDKITAATAVLLGGVLKELDDALREGWSIKDLAMDALGVGAAVLDTKSIRFMSYYTPDRLLITVNFTF